MGEDRSYAMYAELREVEERVRETERYLGRIQDLEDRVDTVGETASATHVWVETTNTRIDVQGNMIEQHERRLSTLELVAKRADAGVGILTGSTEAAVHRLEDGVHSQANRAHGPLEGKYPPGYEQEARDLWNVKAKEVDALVKAASEAEAHFSYVCATRDDVPFLEALRAAIKPFEADRG